MAGMHHYELPQHKVVITGTFQGIGRAIAEEFLSHQHEVYGLDVRPNPFPEKKNYHHYQVDVSDPKQLPDIEGVTILINNAGIQLGTMEELFATNIFGTIYCTEKYGLQPKITSILNIASVSAHNGAEFPNYCATKGAMLSYTISTAKLVAKYGATCNSISPGGVRTPLNLPVMRDENLWKSIMEETPLKKWATEQEIAEWAHFLTVRNKSMTGQDIIIDNLEMFNHNFVWPES